MADHPLILTPVWTQLPFEVGFDVASPENVGGDGQMSRPVLPANLFGLPSACVPAGRDAATGLPIGVLLPGGACATASVSTPPRRSRAAWACGRRSTRSDRLGGRRQSAAR